MAGFIHIVGLLCILAATVLLIVVSVGTPVWKDVYFLTASINGQNLHLGQWGYCYGGACSQTKLGYNLDSLLEESGDLSSNIAGGVVHGLTYALVMNPVAAGFSFLALLFALGSHFVLGLFASILSAFACLVTIVALGLDLGCFVTARHRLNNISGIDASLSNAIWMVVAAAILQFLAIFTVCFTHNSNKRAARRDVEGAGAGAGTSRRGLFGRRNNNVAAAGYGADPVMTQAPPRRHFWQRNRAPAAAAY